MTPTPTVLLVGAGPGDPDLLTLRAEAALAAAATVVTDPDPAMVALATAFAPGASLLAAGPDPAATAALLAGGPPAVRLYRGDPWLHPQWSAEAAALAALTVRHESVPGPAAPLALAAASGVAVHHRPRSVCATLAPLTDLPAPTDPGRTLVTEVADLRAAAAALAAAGDPALPVAAVGADGVTRGPLAELAADGAGLLVVGAVAATTLDRLAVP